MVFNIMEATCANQGIGLATAKALARDHGHHVIIGSRNADAGNKAAEEIRVAGHSASSVQLDLASDDSIAAAVKTVEKEFGKLDVLINNAGILIDTKTDLWTTTRDLYTQTLTTNVIGTACVTDALLPLLRKSSRPNLVFVSSRMGSLHQATVKDTPFYPVDYKAYDASKAAFNILALNYARIVEEWGTGGRSNVVCPQLVKTGLTGFIEYGITPEEGAERIVEIAAQGENGVNRTFSDRHGEIAW
ncbi:short chain dehydrogenase [Lophiostoma macrostomum CBS 122681]|uniref:Short chain dehydrogenase n=1 Tax=Lophiostoma macrostomum CBS 122681 TaxID=1314788 RepID=A0A6A6SMN9_9PLEO|nr:short chain dehydrogenase [Lophiostoma macrostomum CBS 122681]